MPLRRLADSLAIALALGLFAIMWVVLEIMGAVARGIWPLRDKR